MIKSITSGLSSRDQQAIDKICDEFENAWKSGKAPDIREFAGRFDETAALPGLVELVILEAHYRRQAEKTRAPNQTQSKATGNHQSQTSSGLTTEPIIWDEYVLKFPELASIAVPSEFATNDDLERTWGDRYRLLRSHASGGLGRVSLALDIPLGRTVAIKEMHPRFVQDAGFRQRFLREAIITSRLEHPGIVPIYDLCDQNRDDPWYAMRMVRGKSLLEAIRNCHGETIENKSLDIERRKLLNRFVDVCHAVEYAHQQGVIHRDIKPDNIMLGDFGETLLIDWGLAVRLDENNKDDVAELPAETTLQRQTVAATVMGTPHYMSPEQSSPNAASIDHLSDVFALGATLFHILVGRPPKPVGLSNADAPVINSNKKSLAQVPTALHAICRKAMARDPGQRYRSAASIASDVESWLADQPVQAYADPIWTRTRRWLRNHRAMAAASLVALALGIVGLLVFSTISRIHANSLRAKNEQLDQLVTSEKRQREAAEKSEQRTADALQYLVQAFRSPDPNRDGREIRVVDILDQAVEQLESDFADDPLLKAQMLTAFGRTFQGLGRFSEAIPLVEEAREIYLTEFGDSHRVTLATTDQLAEVLYISGDPAAGDLIESVVSISRERFGDTDADTLRFRLTEAEHLRISGRAKQAVAVFQSVLTEFERLYGADDEATLNLMNNLAVAYKDAGLGADAVRMSKLVYENYLERFGPDSTKTISSGSNYAVHMGSTTNRQLATPLHQQFLEAARKKWGNEHHRTLVYINRLGTSLVAENRLDEATPLLLELFETSRSIYGATHTVSLNAENTLAIAWLNAGKYEDAATHFKVLYDLSVKTNGPEHKRTLTFANNLGVAWRNTNNHDGSIGLLQSTLAAQQKSLGPEHPDSLRTMLNLASTMQQAGRYAESIPVSVETHRLVVEHYGPDHGHAQTAQSVEAMAHLKLGDFVAAKSILQAGLESRTRTMPDHWLRYNTMSLLGEALLGLGELNESETLLLEAYQKMLEHKEEIPARARNRIDEARERLVRLYEARQMPEEAGKYRNND